MPTYLAVVFERQKPANVDRTKMYGPVKSSAAWAFLEYAHLRYEGHYPPMRRIPLGDTGRFETNRHVYAVIDTRDNRTRPDRAR